MSSRDNAAEPTIAHGGAALWIGATFLSCVLGVLVFSAAGFGRGSAVETFSETTAVGDQNPFPVPVDALGALEHVFTWSGRQLVLASHEKVKLHDTDMIRIGADESASYALYSLREKPGDKLYVKIDVGEFLLLKQR